MKRILCTGKVEHGKIVITKPTIETLIDAQIARNAELLAMHRDLDALLAGKPPAYRLTPEQLEELEQCDIADDYEWIRRGC